MKVELKKVKIAKYLSEETTAFAAQLWVDGEYIADVSNNGHGGSNRINHRFDGNGLNTRDKVESFEKWCEEQPDHESPHGSLGMNADFYISLMVDDYQSQQEMKRWCKTKTVVRLKGDPEGTFHIYKRPYDSAFADWIRRKEPDLVEIMNERYIKIKV
tara:strand:- start:465 stop:938 length:474 start_codon:yes stop_codon:yes gene_type:complete